MLTARNSESFKEQRSAYRIERRHLFYRPGADGFTIHRAGLRFRPATARLPDRYRHHPMGWCSIPPRPCCCRDDSRHAVWRAPL